MVATDLIRLDSADPTPIYVQIERGIRAAVATGRLPKGAQLPTVRELAVDLRVNANTVAKVYSELDAMAWSKRDGGSEPSSAHPGGRRPRERPAGKPSAISRPGCSRTPRHAAFRAKSSSLQLEVQ